MSTVMGDHKDDLDQMASVIDMGAGRDGLFARLLGFVIGHRKALIAIGVVVLGAGAIVGSCALVAHRMRKLPGQPRGETIGADSVIVVDFVAVGGGKDGRPTRQGMRHTSLDPTTGAERSVDIVDGFDNHASSRSCPTRVDLDGPSPGVRYQLRGHARKQLTTYPPPPAEAERPAAGPALSFASASFLGTIAPLILDTSADSSHALVRFDDLSRARWRVGLGGRCRHAEIVGDLLIVATDNPARRVVAIDLERGTTRWTYGR